MLWKPWTYLVSDQVKTGAGPFVTPPSLQTALKFEHLWLEKEGKACSGARFLPLPKGLTASYAQTTPAAHNVASAATDRPSSPQ